MRHDHPKKSFIIGSPLEKIITADEEATRVSVDHDIRQLAMGAIPSKGVAYVAVYLPPDLP